MPSLARAFRRRRGDGDGEEDNAPDTDFGASLPGLDDDTLPDDSDAGGAAVTSVVSAGRHPAPVLPKRQDYVSDQDYSNYYSMLGKAPVPEEPGKGSKILSVLSDLFLHQDIPGQMRQGEQQRAEQRYSAQLAPIKARIDSGLGAYKSDVDAAEKQATINRQTAGENYYNSRGPTKLAPHYYPGKNDAGEPTEMQVDPNLEGAKPTPVGPRYEAPHNQPGPGNVDEQTFAYLTAPAPKGKGLSADAAYEWIQKQKGMTGAKVGQGEERIGETKTAHDQASYSRAHSQAARELAPEGKNLLGKYYDDQGNFDAEGFAAAIDARAQQLLQQQSGGSQGQGKPAKWNGSAWVDGNTGQPIAAAQ